MSKEKMAGIAKYINDLKNKLASGVTKKHLNREASYRQFLENELKSATATLERLKA